VINLFNKNKWVTTRQIKACRVNRALEIILMRSVWIINSVGSRKKCMFGQAHLIKNNNKATCNQKAMLFKKSLI
jgi:hypothetical protein